MNLLDDYILDNKSDSKAFRLADWYYELQQYASALSFYMRVTEISKCELLIYHALIKIGLCFEKQGNRNHYVKGMYLHAISVQPKRPEAYFLLSRNYERCKDWQESYSMAEIGLSISDFNLSPFKDVEYPGKNGFLFQKSVASWWMGRIDECIKLLLELDKQDMDDEYKIAIKNNLKLVWGTDKPAIPTYKNNYSQAFQDIFVLLINEYKRDGKYLEIGAYKPFEHSNTYLLEKDYGWKGVSLEIDKNLATWFNGKRDNQCLALDATKADYLSILDNKNWGTDWDYLQLDCEPAKNTFEALLLIPFEKYRFKVITYEHDWYCDDKSYRDKSRRYLESMGYELIVSNVSVDEKSPFEDWWVHKELISKDIKDKFRSIKEINPAEQYIFGKK